MPSANSIEFPRTHNEFRSDTFTVPTKEMFQLAAESTVGDAVYNEDEDTVALEQKVAKLAGKEAGLYCVSGTLSNQIGLKAHMLEAPFSILCDYRAHIITNEAAGVATLCQAMPIGVVPSNGEYLTLEDIVERVVPDDGDIHSAPTKLIELENTIGGILMPLSEVERVSRYCKKNGIILHCDGARLWNAAVAEGVELVKFCELFDSVSLCLSKTLGAPIGSVLVGPTKFIKKANHFRKQNGGGIRQSGLLARMASYAVDNNYPKLAKTHEVAKELESFLRGNEILISRPVDTNFVFLDLRKLKWDVKVLKKIAKEHKVNISSARIAIHYQISEESIENLKEALLETKQYFIDNPYDVSAPYVEY